MKKLLRKITVLLVTFVIGVSAYSVWYRKVYSVLYKYNTVTVCEVNKNSKLYNGKIVHLRAIFARTRNDYVLATSPCGSEVRGASIELTPIEAINFPVPKNDYLKERKSERIHLVDAVIVGRLNVLPGFACFTPKYQIENAKVVQVNSILEFENSDEADKWLKSNSY